MHHDSPEPMIPEMRLAFDARVRPHSSFARVLTLLQNSADVAGIPWEAWTEGPCSADVLWSTQQAAIPPVEGPRFVASIYDTNPLMDVSRSFLSRKWNVWKFHRNVRKCTRLAWKISTCSENAQQNILNYFPSMAGHLFTVPLFADKDFSPGAPEPEVLAKLDLQSGYLLYVGALRKHKNWETLVRAWAQLPEPLRKAHQLVLVGRAKRAQNALRKLRNELSPLDSIKIIEDIPDGGLLELYRGADLFCFPSLAEGFGLPPLEALACGIPVVSSDRTSLPEILGPAALYADPLDADALSKVLERGLMDGRTRQFLSRTGPERAAAWNPERTGRAMKELLEL